MPCIFPSQHFYINHKTILTFKREGDQICHLGCQGTFKSKGSVQQVAAGLLPRVQGCCLMWRYFTAFCNFCDFYLFLFFFFFKRGRGKGQHHKYLVLQGPVSISILHRKRCTTFRVPLLDEYIISPCLCSCGISPKEAGTVSGGNGVHSPQKHQTNPTVSEFSCSHVVSVWK